MYTQVSPEATLPGHCKKEFNVGCVSLTSLLVSRRNNRMDSSNVVDHTNVANHALRAWPEKRGFARISLRRPPCLHYVLGRSCEEDATASRSASFNSSDCFWHRSNILLGALRSGDEPSVVQPFGREKTATRRMAEFYSPGFNARLSKRPFQHAENCELFADLAKGSHADSSSSPMGLAQYHPLCGRILYSHAQRCTEALGRCR